MNKIVLILAALAVLTACNTLEGLGKDIKQGGEAIEKTVKDRNK